MIKKTNNNQNEDNKENPLTKLFYEIVVETLEKILKKNNLFEILIKEVVDNLQKINEYKKIVKQNNLLCEKEYKNE